MNILEDIIQKAADNGFTFSEEKTEQYENFIKRRRKDKLYKSIQNKTHATQLVVNELCITLCLLGDYEVRMGDYGENSSDRKKIETKKDLFLLRGRGKFQISWHDKKLYQIEKCLSNTRRSHSDLKRKGRAFTPMEMPNYGELINRVLKDPLIKKKWPEVRYEKDIQMQKSEISPKVYRTK